jgi:YD repeat-containing protein
MPVRQRSGSGDPVYLVDVTAGSESATLPAGYAPGRRITYERTDSSGNTFTLAAASGDYVNGVLNGSLVLSGGGRLAFDRTDPGKWRTSGSSGGDATTALLPDAYTYDASGNVLTSTTGGVTTTYTYNADGSVATEVRAGRSKTYSYDVGGTFTGSAVA